MSRLWQAALAALLLSGCQRCASGTRGADAGDGSAAEPVALEMSPKVKLPAFAAVDSVQGYGLPSGCRFEGKIQKATLAEGQSRFVAARSTLGALALAQGPVDSGRAPVASAGFVDLASRAVVDAPWAELEAPPLMDRASQGWLAAWTQSRVIGTSRALLWRGGPRAEPLLEGDELELSDLACAGDDCVVFSHLARAAAAPGATWMGGKASTPASQWQRVDLELGGDEPWLPLAIAKVSEGGGGWAALSSGKHVALFSVANGRAEKKHVLDAPHGAYDVTFAGEPVVVVPGERIDRPCGAEEFPVVVLTGAGQRHVLRTPGTPESVIARPLGSGALVAWVAPVSCQHSERRVVYLTWLDASGAPASSPMAVADATGFALSTRGDELGLWLLSGRELSFVKARCAVADAG